MGGDHGVVPCRSERPPTARGPGRDQDTCGAVHAGTDRGDLHADGDEPCGQRADERVGDGDRSRAGGADGDGNRRGQLDLHAARGPVYAQRCAGGGPELSGDHADGECGEHARRRA